MNRITYIGHSTLLLDVDGVRILTDPLLARRVTHLRRAVPLPRTTPDKIDAVLLSHLHGDHLHLPSLRRLGKDIRLIVPQGAAPYLTRHGFTNLTEMVPGEITRVKGTAGSIAIEATPAAHDGPPMPWRPPTPTLGYIVHSQRPIYFAGDTDIFPEMATIGKAIDIALLPVWGYGPKLGPGHLDPWRAAESLRLLRPSLAVPIHWGTYYPAGFSPVMTDLLQTPPHQFVTYARSLAPKVNTVVLPPGSSLSVGTGMSFQPTTPQLHHYPLIG